jgi:hypothetical protein
MRPFKSCQRVAAAAAKVGALVTSAAVMPWRRVGADVSPGVDQGAELGGDLGVCVELDHGYLNHAVGGWVQPGGFYVDHGEPAVDVCRMPE